MRLRLLLLCAACVWASDEVNTNVVKEFKADEPEPLCTSDGQFLLHGGSRCKYIRCTYGAEPWVDADGNIQLYAVERDCPYGTAVSRALYREGYGSLEHTRLCTERVKHHPHGGIRYEDPCIVEYPVYHPTYPAQAYPTVHGAYSDHAGYPAQPYPRQAAYTAPAVYATQPSYRAQPYPAQVYPSPGIYSSKAYHAMGYPAYPQGTAYIGYPKYPTYAGVEEKMAKLNGAVDTEVSPFENSVDQGPDEPTSQEQEQDIVDNKKVDENVDQKIDEEVKNFDVEAKEQGPTNHKQTVHALPAPVDEDVEVTEVDQPHELPEVTTLVIKEEEPAVHVDKSMEDVNDKTVEIVMYNEPRGENEPFAEDVGALDHLSQPETHAEDEVALDHTVP